MDYTSTRDGKVSISASEAIIQGISKDGGLFVPCRFPSLQGKLAEYKNLNYQQLAAAIMAEYLPEFNTLDSYAKKAYAEYSSEEVVPVSKLNDNIFMLELWHGPTLAFKDMALQMLPLLMAGSVEIQKIDSKILILVATSGDTGKAALAGFADKSGTAISVFYPQDGVSKAQKLQMTTQKGENVQVTGINGNFDDAQSAVKELFVSSEFNKKVQEQGYNLSSANSINWGRLLPQIVYYFWGYLKLVNNKEIEIGDKVNVCVPTGNFGNILAAYYAKQMGLPIDKFICASNKNHILTDFFTTGEYNINREFYKTNSPSMDILISSNLERLLYHLHGNDDAKIIELMSKLKTDGVYKIDQDLLAKMKQEFFVGSCDEAKTLQDINKVFSNQDYLMDTHTAVAFDVAKQYQEKTGDKKPVIVASTASPYKFAGSVVQALGIAENDDEFVNAQNIADKTGMEIPEQILELKELPIRFSDTCEKDQISNVILDWIK